MEVNRILAAETSRVPNDGYLGILPCEPRETGFYPNVDLSIWLRSCIAEPKTPIQGTITGNIPKWLGGSLIQNGPGKFFFGDEIVSHLFDGSALLQKFEIKEGTVSYTCRFIRSKHFEKNLTAGRIVTNEFATVSSIKKSLRQRLALLTTGDLSEIMSDNTFITVKPLGKDYFCFYESPFVNQIDPVTLETIRKIDLNSTQKIVSNSSHPHYDKDGSMISVGVRVGVKGPEYVVKRDEIGKPFSENTHILAKVRCRWAFNPCYMHSFSITDNYFILIEQPFTVSVARMVGGFLRGRPMVESLKWHGTRSTVFHVIDRRTGKETNIRYKSDPFFFLHTINAYEEDCGHLVLDISCYDNPDMISCMSISSLQRAQSDPDYAKKFRGRPLRFVIPLEERFEMKEGEDLVGLDDTTAKAKVVGRFRKVVRLSPERICDVGCETPTIHYERFNGKPYRFFYAISSDVDDPVNAGQIFKVDTVTKEVTRWAEENAYCSESIFVPRPGDSLSEDDGVILSSIIGGKPEVSYAALLVLDARTMAEVGRAEFQCPGPVPKPLHGCFAGS